MGPAGLALTLTLYWLPAGTSTHASVLGPFTISGRKYWNRKRTKSHYYSMLFPLHSSTTPLRFLLKCTHACEFMGLLQVNWKSSTLAPSSGKLKQPFAPMTLLRPHIIGPQTEIRVIMIILNSFEGRYIQFKHGPWMSAKTAHTYTATYLPSFIFIQLVVKFIL